jgi:hypothetical protein
MEQQSPHNWTSGPPESKSESWNYERRTELLNVSQGILQAQIMGAMKHSPESWQSDDEKGQLPGVNAKKAVDLAKQLIDEVEKIQPKR